MDRFDTLEALAVISWDFGLYGVLDRLQGELRFKHRRGLMGFNDLMENGQRIYGELMGRAANTEPWDRRLAR